MCTKDESHSGKYLAKIMLEVIDEIGPERILAVITDSESSMIKVRKIINEKYKRTAVYSCAAHNLNSLIGDIMKRKTFKDLEVSTKEIVKEINGSHVIRATFVKIQTEI